MTVRRARVLGEARAALVELPDRLEELARCVTERPPVDGGRSGKPGSRPPLRLEVVHLVDDRRKPGWEGDDPREADVTDRYGVAAVLESWTRILVEELPEYPDLAETATVRSECSVLIEHWTWIEDQQWCEELAEDVLILAGRVRAALFERKEPRYLCPRCGERAYLVEGGFLSCANQHEQSVRDLEAQYRRRPPALTRMLAEEFGIPPERIRKWAERKQIKPVRIEGHAALYLPWDVFSLVNPDIRSALDERDEQITVA